MTEQRYELPCRSMQGFVSVHPVPAVAYSDAVEPSDESAMAIGSIGAFILPDES